MVTRYPKISQFYLFSIVLINDIFKVYEIKVFMKQLSNLEKKIRVTENDVALSISVMIYFLIIINTLFHYSPIFKSIVTWCKIPRCTITVCDFTGFRIS